jgi:hypothetical protein
MPVTNHEAGRGLSVPARDPADILEESAGLLAALATRAVYEEQPDLWRFGEAGRARTQEDFVHHFRTLATMDEVVFEAHVRYCEGLFSVRGYPLTWLQDAWRHMAAVVTAELPEAAAAPVMRLLVGVVGNAHAGGESGGSLHSAPSLE